MQLIVLGASENKLQQWSRIRTPLYKIITTIIVFQLHLHGVFVCNGTDMGFFILDLSQLMFVNLLLYPWNVFLPCQLWDLTGLLFYFFQNFHLSFAPRQNPLLLHTKLLLFRISIYFLLFNNLYYNFIIRLQHFSATHRQKCCSQFTFDAHLAH